GGAGDEHVPRHLPPVGFAVEVAFLGVVHGPGDGLDPVGAGALPAHGGAVVGGFFDPDVVAVGEEDGPEGDGPQRGGAVDDVDGAERGHRFEAEFPAGDDDGGDLRGGG